MLQVFIFTLIIMALLLAGMAIGVIMGGKPIQGSCGGMKALQMGTACEICGDDPNKCDNEEVSNARFYNAADNIVDNAAD